jgi:hypothetical protein
LYQNTSGGSNTAIGESTLYNNETASDNTAIGYQALFFNNTGENNTAVGYQAHYYGENISTGTFIGDNTGSFPVDNISNVTALGHNAHVNAENQVRIGNSLVNSIGGNAGWTNLSDERYKTDILENVAGLDFILRLRPVTYHLDMNKLATDLGEDREWDDRGRAITVAPKAFEIKSRNEKAGITYTGFIAQEVEALAKSIGYDFSGVDAPANQHGFYGLRYAEFVVPLVKAMQEQQDIIESQQKQIEELIQRVNELEKGRPINDGINPMGYGK